MIVRKQTKNTSVVSDPIEILEALVGLKDVRVLHYECSGPDVDVSKWRTACHTPHGSCANRGGRIVPLTALSEGEVIDATICSDDDFARVHRVRPRAILVCRECGAPVHAKESKYGLRFFAHDRQQSGCTSAGESPEHRALKRWIADVVRRLGWAACLEEGPGPCDFGGWRADLLAVNPEGTRRVAFEVQLASMPATEGAERTERYERDDIETVWITTRHAPWLLAIPGVRVIEFDAERSCDPKVDRGLVAMVPGWRQFENSQVSLDFFVQSYLKSEIIPRRLVSYDEEYHYGDQPRSTFHTPAHVFMTIKNSVEHDARERRMAEEIEREELHQHHIRELARRQAALLPEVVDEAMRHAVEGDQLSVGIQTSWTRPRYWMPGHPAEGNEKTAFGIPVRLDRVDGSSRLFAVVCPVAGRISSGLARSWIKRGVRVYVESEAEATRVANAVGRRDIVWMLAPLPEAE